MRVISLHATETTDGLPLVEVTMQCPYCGQPAMVSAPAEGFAEWQAGRSIQSALPELTAGQREILLSGSHEACFDKMFPDAGDPFG